MSPGYRITFKQVEYFRYGKSVLERNIRYHDLNWNTDRLIRVGVKPGYGS